MTSGAPGPHHTVDASPEGLRRTLDLARLALRAQDAVLLSPYDQDVPAFDEHASTLAAPVTLDGAAVAHLVARDAAGRDWSEDDRTILGGLADGLAAEIQLRGERARHPGAVDALVEASEVHALSPQASATDAAQPPVLAEQQELDALHILLADDLDLNRKLICDMLSLDGYLVDSVADGAAAVEAAKAKAYDLILMDMIMPGMDGMDATRAIRALPSPACDVPIVALTAYSFREQLDNCLHAGMNATLTKPMSFDALSTAVSTWARSRRQAA